MVRRMLKRNFVLLALFLALAAGTARANDFLDRPIRFLLGFGTGGPTDVVARTLADQVSKELNRTVVVENRPGAAGNLATQAAVTADADGLTYLVAATPLAVNEATMPEFPVRFGRDLVAVAPIGANTNVLVVRSDFGVKTLAEFAARARAKEEGISYATLGVGSSSHLAGVAFDAQAGTKMLPVAYRGGGDALKDLLGAHIDAWFAPVPSVLGAIQSGKLVPLATTGPQRAGSLPNVPTMIEQGFPGFDVRLWVGVFARPTVPVEQLRAMEGAIARAMQNPEMLETLRRQGIAPMDMTRDEFSAFVVHEIARAKGLAVALMSKSKN
jgi:tripartite-type tricarboxylate transporter receptor subunit TctC